MNKELESFSIDDDSEPIAWISSGLDDYIKDVIRKNWNYTSSGLGDHQSFNDWVKRDA